MYILDINKKIKSTIKVYFIITILTIVFDRIYAIFSHGVASLSMNLMFLYPLAGGVGFYLILSYLLKDIKCDSRVLFNIYNSGIATLTIGSLLKGIMDIAGTSSKYIIYYRVIGIVFIIISIIGLIKIYINNKQF